MGQNKLKKESLQNGHVICQHLSMWPDPVPMLVHTYTIWKWKMSSQGILKSVDGDHGRSGWP